MKPLFLLIIAVMLILSACKKNINEKKSVVSETAVNGPVNCTGDTWEQVQNFVGWAATTCLVYNNKAYFFHHGPDDNPYQNTITIYDGTSWQTIQSDIPATALATNFKLVKFVIGNKGYLSSPDCKNIFAYDFATNTWTPKSTFPGPQRSGVTSFSIGNKGYLTSGTYGGTHYNDLWEYNPVSDSWTQKPSFPNFGKEFATGFSIGNKGYILNGIIATGSDPVYYFYLNDLMEYDPSTESWDVKAPYPGEPSNGTDCFVTGGYGYAGYGKNRTTSFNDFYRYSPSTDSWSATAQCPLDVAIAGFSINSKGYLVGRTDRSSTIKMFKYNPKVCTPVSQGSGAN